MKRVVKESGIERPKVTERTEIATKMTVVRDIGTGNAHRNQEFIPHQFIHDRQNTGNCTEQGFYEVRQGGRTTTTG